MATRSELQAVHGPRLIDMIEALVAAGGELIDPDTPVDAACYRAARHAAGAACEMVWSADGRTGPDRVCGAASPPATTPNEPARWGSAC